VRCALLNEPATVCAVMMYGASVLCVQSEAGDGILRHVGRRADGDSVDWPADDAGDAADRSGRGRSSSVHHHARFQQGWRHRQAGVYGHVDSYVRMMDAQRLGYNDNGKQ